MDSLEATKNAVQTELLKKDDWILSDLPEKQFEELLSRLSKAAIIAWLEAEQVIVMDAPIIPDATPEHFDPFRINAYLEERIQELKDATS